MRPLAAFALLSWFSLPVVLWRLRLGLRETSLSGLWKWGTLCWVAAGAAGLTLVGLELPAGLTDIFWYFVAVLMLLPPIAVLGARRPINRVWPWFILWPLVLVFSWPALSGLFSGGTNTAWSVEEPVCAGYCLVVVMGAGNYVWHRHAVSAFLWIGALLLLVGSLCPTTAAWLPAKPDSRVWAMLLVSASGWLVVVRAGRRESPSEQSLHAAELSPSARRASASFDKVWLDFGETFGVVWSRRVQERFNDEMHRLKLPVRLSHDGMKGSSDQADSPGGIAPGDASKACATLRWLLQKFVDPAWIDARLGTVQVLQKVDSAVG